jgi:hypothetical protein
MFSTQSVVQLIFTTTERTSLPIRHFAWVLAQNLHDTVPPFDADARPALLLYRSLSYASSSSVVILTCSLKSTIISASEFPIALGEEEDAFEEKR